MPELTYTVSGLASGDSLSGTVSLSCEATDTNTAGTYTITCDFLDESGSSLFRYSANKVID